MTPDEIANVLKSVCAGTEEEYQEWCMVVEAFADAFEAKDPSFDRLKFLEACGYEPQAA
jgi:hypothetical protein